MIERIEFGQRLRRERERRGVRLETIAQSTKIKVSLLDALERGDVSHWPSGIFGRGFLRAYLTAIHLPTEPLVAEFQSLGLSSIAAGGTRGEKEALRLTLEPDSEPLPPLAKRMIAVVAETSAALAAAALVSRLTGASVWIAATAALSIYSAAATLWFGRSPALWLANRRADRTDFGVVAIDAIDAGHSLADTSTGPRLTLAGD